MSPVPLPSGRPRPARRPPRRPVAWHVSSFVLVGLLTVAASMQHLDPTRGAPDPVRDRGQATTEYALVLLAAALVGLLVVAWATSGGGAGRIGALFDRVIDAVMSRV